MGGEQSKPTPPPEDLPLEQRLACLKSVDLDGIIELLSRAKRVVCLCGAGISVSAGIPDFRTPGTGLYSQLESKSFPPLCVIHQRLAQPQNDRN
jgi:hypothetical protein